MFVVSEVMFVSVWVPGKNTSYAAISFRLQTADQKQRTFIKFHEVTT